MNTQYGVRDFKYVATCDPYLVSRDDACALRQKRFIIGRLDQYTTLNYHRSPLKVAMFTGNMGFRISSTWLLVSPYLVSRDDACVLRHKRFIMGRPISKLPLTVTADP